ncbi:MAG: hypothetical protein WC028_22840 [Candidatus Obscuribacterales bacterium]
MICVEQRNLIAESVVARKRSRRPTPGPELALVEKFLTSNCLPSPAAHQELTVFIEPWVESGYPDLVAVYWDRTKVERWPQARLKLTKSDLRLAHYLYVVQPTCIVDLTEIFGKSVTKSLQRLMDAELLLAQSGTVALRPFEDIFAIERLVAIEAKVTNWKEGLCQAVQNTWFASESYLLLPKVPNNQGLIERARELGIGLLELNSHFDCGSTFARKETFPQSHGCWYFNEWLAIAEPS